VERKARFIAQLKSGNTEDRTVADLGGDELGNAAAATKAVATGDPRYVEQVSLEDDVKRLSAMVRAHSDAKGRNAAERRSVAREVTAVTEQMVELDRALPALAANSGAPFAMRVGVRTYRERAEVAPVLVDSLGHAYGEGKRYGNTEEFPIAELRGVQVVASRMLSGDEMVVKLSVPGRSRSIQARDFTGRDTAWVGLVRRVENMVADTPNYRDELHRRHGHALTRIGELEAVADEPFEHTDALRDKRYRLDTLTAALQTSADSPEAKAKEAEHQQRLDARGREPGWSLALNPTSALRVEFGDAELARRAGHGGGSSDTRGLVGAGVGAGRGDPAAGQGSSGVPRAVRLAYLGQGNPSTAPIGWAEDVLGRRRPRPQPRTGAATRTAAGKSRSAIRVIPRRVREAPPGGGWARPGRGCVRGGVCGCGVSSAVGVRRR